MWILNASANVVTGLCAFSIALLLISGRFVGRRAPITPLGYIFAVFLGLVGVHFLASAYLLIFAPLSSASAVREASGGPLNGVLDVLLAVAALSAVALHLRFPAPWNGRSLSRQFQQAECDAASIDAVTGLPNRSALAQTIARYRDDSSSAIVVHIDLQGLPQVNIDHGRDTGDRILRDLAQRLAGGLREREYVFHLGGVEFVVIGVGHAPAGAASLYARTETLISRPIPVAGSLLSVANSVATRFGTADELETLILRAHNVAGTTRSGPFGRPA